MAEFSRATREFNEKTSKQTEKLIWLTKLIAFLTVVMIGGIAFQIYLAKIQVSPILSEQERNQRQAFEFCNGNPDSNWPSATGGEIQCEDVLEMLGDEFK